MSQKRFSASSLFRFRLDEFVEQKNRLLPAGILLLALIVRVLALLDLKSTVYFDFMLWDERLYHEWAARIADGTFSSEAVYEFPPFPAYLAALLYRLFSPDIVYVRYMNIIAGTATCGLLYGIGRRIGGSSAGLMAGLIAAIYAPMVLYSVVPLKTAVGVFFFALAVLLFLRSLRKAGWVSLFFLGAASGVVLNIRPNVLVLLPAFPLLLLWGHRDRPRFLRRSGLIVGVFLAGFGVAVSPFVLRNLTVADRFALTTSQAGFNLYLGNHLHSPDPFYRPVPFAITSPFAQGVQFTIEASRRGEKRLTSGQASVFWAREVFSTLREHPRAFFTKLTRKALVLFNRYEPGDHYNIGFLRREAGFKAGFLPGFAWVFPLGMAGLLLAAVRKSKVDIALLVLFLLYGLTMVIFFTTARYRLILMVMLFPYAAAGLLELFRKAKSRQYRSLLLVSSVVAAGVVLEFLPVRGTGDMTAYYNTHAIVMDAAGERQAAVRYWKESSAMEQGFSDFANLSLAGIYLAGGNTKEAKLWLDNMAEGSFAEAQKLDLMGDVAVMEGRFNAAVAFYRAALSINSGLLKPRARLIRLFERANPALAREELQKGKEIESFYWEAHGKR